MRKLGDPNWWQRFVVFLLFCASVSLMFSPVHNWLGGGEVKWVQLTLGVILLLVVMGWVDKLIKKDRDNRR